jgi:hypothetical protein
MAYLTCGRCGLQIRIRADYLRLDNCPRCLARSAIVSPMAVSATHVSPAAGWGTRGEPDPRDPHPPLSLPVAAAGAPETAAPPAAGPAPRSSPA